MDAGTCQVPVAGGALTVHLLTQAPAGTGTVLALHSISSNGLAWQPLATTLAGGLSVVAPDMRGRAESSRLRSTGLADHVRDVLAVIEHLGLERPVLAGHSMGAFVAALAAASRPDVVGGVLLVDGGLAYPTPGSFDVDEVLHGIIGPAMDRLTMTFEDDQAYLEHWREHPTLGPALARTNGDALAAYLQHDLAGAPGAMRSSSSLECVRADWADMMSDPATLAAVHTLQCPAVLAWAARGPLGQEPGLYSPARLAQAHLPADVRTVRLDADHYGTLLDPGSLDALADALLALVAGPRSGRGIHIPIR
ncbi:alpha/beta hydrolase [Phycicoccus sp. M110.8]|uniref:alpha/beta fold hydrolase n=1 Tax=Phycicoccus sp. M110.8 TaxID=3075433 RepID=UPI0028FD63A1|nr:alpha/beta hydrolase [Phycicoccus sp. M110.8]MDU0315599.1 alpha/beta hydrolase [Phycicoccus sp. M110.8]